ncbi:MAG: recombinase family protein [Kangiella sp.]|nr:recombinase family protein [Kangiella sp.]
MSVYGYARVSTTDQDLTVQEETLRKAGCEVVRSEKISGTKATEDRPELRTLMEFLREGDTLVVTRLDRLARSMRDLHNLSHDLEARKVSLRVLEQAVDTSTSSGRAFFGMLSVFAQFETDLRRERQMEGIEKAKAEGRYRGRKPSIDPDEVRRLKGEGLGASAIAKELGIGRASVYRVLG